MKLIREQIEEFTQFRNPLASKPVKYSIKSIITFYMILINEYPNIHMQVLRHLDNAKNAYLEHNFGFKCGISEKALELRQSAYSGPAQGIDHCMPFHPWMKRLQAQNFQTIEELADYFVNNFYVCEVTHEDNALLNHLHLRSKMPNGWDVLTGDPYARYRAAGINFHPPISPKNVKIL